MKCKYIKKVGLREGFALNLSSKFGAKFANFVSNHNAKEMEINKSSFFCCVLSFLMIFLLHDIKRENRCNQNQVQDSAN